jgi:hypothetical protein
MSRVTYQDAMEPNSIGNSMDPVVILSWAGIIPSRKISERLSSPWGIYSCMRQVNESSSNRLSIHERKQIRHASLYPDACTNVEYDQW